MPCTKMYSERDLKVLESAITHQFSSDEIALYDSPITLFMIDKCIKSNF